jgi:hypothetical protein
MRTVLIGEIHLEAPNWKNPREFTGLSDKELDELAADIKAVRTQSTDKEKPSGIIDPPKVVKVKSNGSFINLAIDGQRRLLAGSRVLPKNTPIEVIDLEDEPIDLTPEKADELTLKALRMFNREPLSSYELSTVAESMRTRDRPLRDISDAIHKSESWVSRMLKARSTASPKLMLAWRKGEITDEQFKDLAAQRDKEAQDKDTEEVVTARKSGDVTEARSKTKELVETAKQKKARAKAEKLAAKQAAKDAKARELADKKAAKEAKKAGKGKSVTADAGTHPDVDPERANLKALAKGWTPPVEKPKKPQGPSRAALEEIVALADKRPPTHDIVKGVILGVRYGLGLLEQHEFGKAWSAWVSRVGGATEAPAKRTYAAVRAGKKERKKIHAKLARTANRAKKVKLVKKARGKKR